LISSKDERLGKIKQLDSESEKTFSIEVFMQRIRTCFRFLKVMPPDITSHHTLS
jgi:hypothetical protein